MIDNNLSFDQWLRDFDKHQKIELMFVMASIIYGFLKIGVHPHKLLNSTV